MPRSAFTRCSTHEFMGSVLVSFLLVILLLRDRAGPCWLRAARAP
jgi:hypothetical protein